MEFLQTAQKYLKTCEIDIDDKFLKEQLMSHPNYPSLLSLTDTLDILQIEYAAVQVQKDQIFELNFPLLAYSYNGLGNFTIISSEKDVEGNKSNFLDTWEGIVLMVVKKGKVKSKEYNAYLKKAIKNQQLTSALLLGLIFFFIASSFLHFNIYSFLFSSLSACGIGMCTLILLHDMGKDNIITHKLCDTNGTGCDKVLKSKAGKLWKDIGLGDLGLIYFTTIFLFLFVAALNNNIENALNLLLISTVAAFAFTFFSLYYQYQVIKSWCRMCLIVVGILWVQMILMKLYFPSFYSFNLLSVNIEAIFLFFLCFILSSSWLLVKQLLTKADQSETYKIDILRWKRNSDIFLSLLSKERNVNSKAWVEDILLGNSDASVQILVVINPYCEPCAKEYEQLNKLIETYPNDVGIIIRFAVSSGSNKNDKRRIAVKDIVNAIYCLQSRKDKENVLNDWFQWMDLNKWKEKYSFEYREERNLEVTIDKHEEWCERSNITSTPTFFINGYEYPKQYELKDLQSLIFTMA